MPAPDLNESFSAAAVLPPTASHDGPAIKRAHITKKIGDLAAENDFTIIGDGDHSNRDVQGYITSPEVVDALKKAGVKHLFIEMPQEYQYHADDLVNGVTTKDEFIGAMRGLGNLWDPDEQARDSRFGNIADSILAAHKGGMKVHFADPGVGFENALPPYVQEKEADLARKTLEDSGLTPSGDYARDRARIQRDPDLARLNDANRREYIEHMSGEERAMLDKAVEEFASKPVNVDVMARFDDTALAEFVESVSNGQKAAVVYGGGHNQLGWLLEEKGHSVGSVDIYPKVTDMNVPGVEDIVADIETDTVTSRRERLYGAAAP